MDGVVWRDKNLGRSRFHAGRCFLLNARLRLFDKATTIVADLVDPNWHIGILRRRMPACLR
jgi:hypothetical protein